MKNIDPSSIELSSDNQEIVKKINEFYSLKFSKENQIKIDQIIKPFLDQIISSNNPDYLLDNNNNLIFVIAKYDLSDHLKNIFEFLASNEFLSKREAPLVNILANFRDKNHYTLLHIACVYGSQNVAQILIKNNADVSAKLSNQDRNWLPIHLAVKNNYLNLVKILLQNNADIEAKTYFGLTPFLIACEFGNQEIAEFLISMNCQIDVKTISENNSMSALHYAAVGGFHQIIQDLINLKIDIDEKTDDSSTSLHFAAVSGSKNAVELLLKNGADFRQKNQQNKNAVDIAIAKENIDVLSSFLKFGIVDIDESLKKANKKGNSGIINLLKNYQKNIAKIFDLKDDSQKIFKQIEQFNENNIFEDIIKIDDSGDISFNAIGVLSITKKVGLIFKENKTILQHCYDNNKDSEIDVLIKLGKIVRKKISENHLKLYQI